MSMVKLLSWSILLTGVRTPAGWEVICKSSEQGYTIVENFLELSKPEMTQKGLTNRFERLIAKSDADELYVVATSEHRLIRELKNPTVAFRSMHGPWLDPIRTSGPVAYLFKIRDNAFVQYRDSEGAVGWFTLRGENLFLEVFGGGHMAYVGQSFIRLSGSPCEDQKRELGFLVSGLSREETVQLARSLDEAFHLPSQLVISLWNSWQPARKAVYRYPTIGDLSAAHEASAKEKNIQRLVTLFREAGGGRTITVYENGRLISRENG